MKQALPPIPDATPGTRLDVRLTITLEADLAGTDHKFYRGYVESNTFHQTPIGLCEISQTILDALSRQNDLGRLAAKLHDEATA